MVVSEKADVPTVLFDIRAFNIVVTMNVSSSHQNLSFQH